MRRKSKGALERGKSMTAAAGDAIGGAAIAATRLVIRKASAAVRSADHALYGLPAKRKRARTATKSKRRSAKRRTRRAMVRTRAKARTAAARARTRSRAMTKKRRGRTTRSKRRG